MELSLSEEQHVWPNVKRGKTFYCSIAAGSCHWLYIAWLNNYVFVADNYESCVGLKGYSIHPLALQTSQEMIYRNRTIHNTNRLKCREICSMDKALCERWRGCTAGNTIENSRTTWISLCRSVDSDPPLEKYSIEGEGNSWMEKPPTVPLQTSKRA